MASATRETVEIDHHELSISNLDKVLYPESGFTKGQVLDYYVRVAPVILPHLKGRPLTLKRYPNGVDSMFFYEKRCPTHKPDWIKTVRVHSTKSGDIFFCTIDGPAALAWVANLASIELHVLLSRDPNVDRPTAVAFDFDPGPPAGILEACRALLMVKKVLDHLGLESFPKTSGGKGIHLYVPLNTPGMTFDHTKEFAHNLAMLLEREHPEQITSNPLKVKRTGKVFMDWSQNDFHKTTVCAYSLRARSQPTVSTPVTWAEIDKAVKKKKPEVLHFESEDVMKRIDAHGDLFAPVLKLKQKLKG